LKRVLTTTIVVMTIAGVSSVSALAQEQAPRVQLQSEDVEPRLIGRPGTTLIGFSGYVDRFFSNEEVFPANYLAQVDVCHFITKRFAIRAGAVGTGQFGGTEDDGDERPTGTGAPALHAAGGVLFYFTPESMISLYVGGEYWAQITQRAEGGHDTGSVLGTAGIHAAISSRASVFVQGGVGANLSRGGEDELQTRFVAQMGLRFKL
jgi:hypothetical protein